MIDEQKFSIPLDSPLDVNSNDMLVNAAQPRFMFNRQRYLGSLMQTSVRYESDGYMAGWWDHDFELSNLGTNYIDTDTLENTIYATDRKTYNGWRYFMIDVPSADNLVVYVSPKLNEKWLKGNKSTIIRTGDAVEVKGQTTKGLNFTLTADVYDRPIYPDDKPYTFTSDNNLLELSLFDIHNGEIHAIINRTAVDSDYITIRENKPLIYNNAELAYTYVHNEEKDRYESRWADDFVMYEIAAEPKLKVEALADGEFDVLDGQVVTKLNEYDERVTVPIRNNVPLKITSTLTFRSLWTAMSFGTFELASSNIGITDGQRTQTINKQVGTLKSLQKGMSAIGAAEITYEVPIWLRCQQKSTFQFTNIVGNTATLQYIPATVSSSSLQGVKEVTTGAVCYWAIVVQRSSTSYYDSNGTEHTTKTWVWRTGGDLALPNCTTTDIVELRLYWVNQDTTFPISTTAIDKLPTSNWKLSDPGYGSAYFKIQPSTKISSWTDYSENILDYIMPDPSPIPPPPTDTDRVIPTTLTRYIVVHDTTDTYYKVRNTVPYFVFAKIPVPPEPPPDPTPPPDYKWEYVYDDALATTEVTTEGSIATFTLPICVSGYALYKLSTTNIALSNTNVFSIESILNPTGMRCFRIDDGGITGNEDPPLTTSYVIDFMSVKMNFGNQDDYGGGIELVTQLLFSTKNGGLLYYCFYTADLDFDAETSADETKTRPTDFTRLKETYPAWMVDDNPAGSNSVYRPIAGNINNRTFGNVTLNISTYNIISGVSNSKEATRDTQFDVDVLNTLNPVTTIVPTFSDITTTTTTQVVTIYANKAAADADSDYTRLIWNLKKQVFDKNPTDNPRDHYGIEWLLKTATSINDKNDTITTIIATKAETTLDFYRMFVLDKSGLMEEVIVTAQTKNYATLTEGYGRIDLQNNILVDGTKVAWVRTTIETTDDTEPVPLDPEVIQLFVRVTDGADFTFIPEGIFYADPMVTYISTDQDSQYYKVKFKYNPDDTVEHTLFIEDIDPMSVLVYRTKDIRSGDFKEVYRRNIADVYMFIKQFWSNNVDTENYWWIDAEHVLELTKFEFILWVKAGGIDDWMGNTWKVETYTDVQGKIFPARVSRGAIIETEDLQYSVSNAKNTIPVLWKLRTDTAEEAIHILYMRVTAENIVAPNWIDIDIPVVKTDLENRLLDSSISSYSDLTAEAIIGGAKISTTAIGDHFIFGIRLNRGLNQWTVHIKGNSVENVITGYGCVGLDGSLTGGQLPAEDCGENGFSAKVLPVSALPAESETLVPGVYGTESQIWFVRDKTENIVSHLLFDLTTEKFTPVTIALNNNISYRYENASFASGMIADLAPMSASIETFINFLGSGDITTIVQDATKSITGNLGPVFYMWSPCYAKFAHLNHSLGRYCYKWYNSAEEVPKDDAGEDISFCRITKKEEFTKSDFVGSIVVEIIARAFADIMPPVLDYSANKALNANTPTDSKNNNTYSQFFMDNVASTIENVFAVSGAAITLNSELVMKYYLNNFYSISDKCECYAGPGFVQHHFIGQCLAESVTDTQVNGGKAVYTVPLLGLSQTKLKLEVMVLEVVRDALNQAIAAVDGSSIEVGGFATTAIVGGGAWATVPGAAISWILKIFAVTNNALIAAYNVCLDYILPALAEIVGAASNSNAGTVSKRNVQLEAPHAYGEKPMVFMWPCFDIDEPVSYTNESVQASFKLQDAVLDLGVRDMNQAIKVWPTVDHRTDAIPASSFSLTFNDKIYNVNIACLGKSEKVDAPEDMAVIEGTTTFLSKSEFKNEQIALPSPTFPPPSIHDYVIDKNWKLGVTAAQGEVISYTCDDTKLIDGPASNIVVTDTFCGIASSYIAMEIKDYFDQDYLRPVTLTPTAIGLNINRYNSVHEAKAYHAFDGTSNRIVKWTGGAGLDKNYNIQQYCFQINDHFKRSNIFPPSQYWGNFQGPPVQAIRSYDRIANTIQSLAELKGVMNDIPGENKDLQRFAIPVHSEPISTLPAAVRMLAPYKLHVVEGVTSLCTDVRTTQTAYKAPTSIDFNIYGDMYRATEEFICQITQTGGVNAIQDVVASAGLTFIGATTKEAFFYSAATRMYYSFSGKVDLTMRDIINRFKDVGTGRWDFVNQEIVFKCLMGEQALVCRLNTDIAGELYPPNETINNENYDFKLFSVASGTVFQGPRRFVVSRFITLDSMFDDIRRNKKKWDKLSRDEYHVERNYGWEYSDVMTPAPSSAVDGWTHNPFKLATAMLGIDEETDCKFEWQLTFAWTEQMDELFATNEFTCVNLMAETVTPGGMLRSEVTHVFLFKECFQRMGSAGYYTFTFQSNNGIGNRERLYVWSDGIIALEDLTLYCKTITPRRMQPLHTQVDVQDREEL